MQNETFVAKNTIQSTVSISESLNIGYKAGKTIILSPNFEVKAGATFYAMIEDCVNQNMQKTIQTRQGNNNSAKQERFILQPINWSSSC